MAKIQEMQRFVAKNGKRKHLRENDGKLKFLLLTEGNISSKSLFFIALSPIFLVWKKLAEKWGFGLFSTIISKKRHILPQKYHCFTHYLLYLQRKKA